MANFGNISWSTRSHRRPGQRERLHPPSVLEKINTEIRPRGVCYLITRVIRYDTHPPGRYPRIRQSQNTTMKNATYSSCKKIARSRAHLARPQSADLHVKLRVLQRSPGRLHHSQFHALRFQHSVRVHGLKGGSAAKGVLFCESRGTLLHPLLRQKCGIPSPPHPVTGERHCPL